MTTTGTTMGDIAAGSEPRQATLPPAIDAIVRAVCAVTGHDRALLLSRRRLDVAEARMMVYALARECGYGLLPIARRLGRDHTTVLYGARRIAERVAEDPALAALMARARAAARNGGRIPSGPPQPQPEDSPPQSDEPPPRQHHEAGMAEIVMAASAACGIPHEAICNRSQHQAYTTARQIAAMLMIERGISIAEVAVRLKRDTDTVVQGIHTLRIKRARDAGIDEACALARENLARLRAGKPPLPAPSSALGMGLQRHAAQGRAEAAAITATPQVTLRDDVVLVCRAGKWDLVPKAGRRVP